MGGCRCLPCKSANAVYAATCAKRKREGDDNPLVSADDARRHLRELSKKGVGYKTAADAARVAASVVFKIVSGEKVRVRKRTSDRLLAVTHHAVADRACIPAGPTWQRIRWLLAEGFTKSALAKRLGAKTPALQIGRHRVTAATANKVERLYNRLREGE